jgi:hypothetical protein
MGIQVACPIRELVLRALVGKWAVMEVGLVDEVVCG